MVAEALAMERPVVATNVTGTCDIMREELAPFLYPARRHDACCRLDRRPPAQSGPVFTVRPYWPREGGGAVCLGGHAQLT